MTANSPTFYAGLAKVAHDLIVKFGGPAKLRRTGQVVYDPTTGATTSPGVVDFPVNACVFDFPAQDVNGTLIQTGDKQVYLSAMSLDAPTLADQFVTADDHAYTIVKVTALAPGGTEVLYTLQVRS